MEIAGISIPQNRMRLPDLELRFITDLEADQTVNGCVGRLISGRGPCFRTKRAINQTIGGKESISADSAEIQSLSSFHGGKQYLDFSLYIERERGIGIFLFALAFDQEDLDGYWADWIRST